MELCLSGQVDKHFLGITLSVYLCLLLLRFSICLFISPCLCLSVCLSLSLSLSLCLSLSLSLSYHIQKFQKGRCYFIGLCIMICVILTLFPLICTKMHSSWMRTACLCIGPGCWGEVVGVQSGGVRPGGWWLSTPPPPPGRPPPLSVTMWPIPWCIWSHLPLFSDRMTETCENIAFACFATQAVMKIVCYFMLWKISLEPLLMIK